MVEIQFQTRVQTVRSDNALELGSSSSGSLFFSEKGIIHQTSCPHIPQQNGVVKRKHRHLPETTRALLFQSYLPIKFWGDCLLTATYLINRFPSPLLKNKSPYELLFGKAPTYSHLRSFGCLCYSTMPKIYRDKFHPRSIPCVFLGYPFAKKGYKLYNLTTQSCFVSRDVIFHEHIFPFLKPSPSPSLVLPSPLSPGHFSDDSTSSIPTSIPGHSSPPILPAHISPDSTSSLSPSIPMPSPSIFTPDLSSDVSTSPLSSPAHISSTPSSDHPPLRRSSRLIMSLPIFGTFSESVSFNATTSQLHIPEPYTYSQVVAVPEWQEAMRKEFEALEANRTWDIVELPLHWPLFQLDVNNVFYMGILMKRFS
ncbi:uncharacterized protein LOC107830311 [Nicotiana tabacum]|uniref:uncharacterized protein LOC107830311 n=1 Tax=Nicotiana tabacum TaxID=4097 RepID=UPI003F4E5824